MVCISKQLHFFFYIFDIVLVIFAPWQKYGPIYQTKQRILHFRVIFLKYESKSCLDSSKIVARNRLSRSTSFHILREVVNLFLTGLSSQLFLLSHLICDCLSLTITPTLFSGDKNIGKYPTFSSSFHF